jgi:hypothetical protein
MDAAQVRLRALGCVTLFTDESSFLLSPTLTGRPATSASKRFAS